MERCGNKDLGLRAEVNVVSKSCKYRAEAERHHFHSPKRASDLHQQCAFGRHYLDPPCRWSPNKHNELRALVDSEEAVDTHNELMTLILQPLLNSKLYAQR